MSNKQSNSGYRRESHYEKTKKAKHSQSEIIDHVKLDNIPKCFMCKIRSKQNKPCSACGISPKTPWKKIRSDKAG